MDANLDLDHALTRLDAGRLLRIADPEGRGIAVIGGAVWITQQGDARDLFVAEGESFTFDRPGLALVQALRPSRLLVYEPPPSYSASGRYAAEAYAA